MKARLLLSGVILAGIALCSVVRTPPSDQDISAVRAAIGQSPVVAEALIEKAKDHPDLAQAILKYSKTETEISAEDGSPFAMAELTAHVTAIAPGCSGSFSDRHTIKFPSADFGITIAWQQITVHGFCWNGNRITWWGGATVRRWSAFAYCWNDTSQGDVWNSYPKWREAFAYGVLGGNSGFGCISLQSDQVTMYYANGGGIFRH